MYPLCIPFLIYSLTTLTYTIWVLSMGAREVGGKRVGWTFLCHILLCHF